MREGNVRTTTKEKLAVTLDGKQIASVVVGALVILAVVFVLGLNVGRQIGARQAEGARASLDALDSAPKGPAVPQASLTFHDRLTQAKPEGAPPTVQSPAPQKPAEPPPEKPAEKPTPEKPTPERLAAAAAITAAPSPPVEKPAPAVSAPAARPAAEPAPPAAYTIQLGASSDRGEADRIAARFESFRPRVEAAEVAGKGRVYRVRVGSFDTREAAERYLADVTRETGATGWVTAAR